VQGREGREGDGRLTCLPPRFDNPGYGPVRGGKGGGGKGGREREGWRKGRRTGRERERDLALPENKSWRRHCLLLQIQKSYEYHIHNKSNYNKLKTTNRNFICKE